MTWFDNIKDLQYYHQPKDVPCYCDAVGYPFDMYLQGQLQGNGNYSVSLYVYSADGLTQYENATTYFDVYTGIMPNGVHFFNARLKSFSPAMCAHECYIIKAVVSQSGGMTVFEKYTERYCQNNCCDVPRNITLEQTGFSPMVISNPGNDPIVSGSSIDLTLDPTIFIPTGNCGEQLIRIISVFDCIDNFTGDFYGTPTTVLSGTASFEYRKITTIKGRIVRRPREITREMSYNCKLQRSESTAQYLLEGFEYLPPWKMYEIENQLHANKLYIDDFAGVREYQYAGGTPMKQISKCFELFKLEATLQDCTQRQVFGCAENCTKPTNFDGSNIMFAIPASYNDGGFYNSNKEHIATDYTGLMDYLRTQTGATAVNDVNTVTMNCTPYKVVSVTSEGQIDSHIYHDAPVASNKISGKTVSNINDLCGGLPVICIKPVAGTITIATFICVTPVNGTVIVENIHVTPFTINGYGTWEQQPAHTTGYVYNNQVTFSLMVINNTITEDPDAPGAGVPVYETIAVMGGMARPSAMIELNSSNNALPENVSITIDQLGRIMYYGPTTSSTISSTTIHLTNLTYNI